MSLTPDEATRLARLREMQAARETNQIIWRDSLVMIKREIAQLEAKENADASGEVHGTP